MIWRWLALALILLFAAAIAWLAGLTVFEHDARRELADPPASDGIVALTGGAGRIETAFRLFAEGKAPRLLVSGVGGGADLAEFARHSSLAPALLADQGVTIGRAAADTVGNAAETATWARRYGIRSLLVVTAGYHMRRALAEIARQLPDVTLRPVPARSPALLRPDHAAALPVLAVEFDKFLAAWSGISRSFARGPRP